MGNINDNGYILSSKIWVFPCVNRKPGTNVESKLSSEENITNEVNGFGRNIPNIKDSYILNVSDSAQEHIKTYTVCIHGYRFKFELDTSAESADLNKHFACINLIKETDTTTTKYLTHLKSFATGDYLDIKESEQSETNRFVGIKFVATSEAAATNNYYLDLTEATNNYIIESDAIESRKRGIAVTGYLVNGEETSANNYGIKQLDETNSNNSTHKGAVVLGHGNNSVANYGVVIGKYNADASSSLFVIGGGTGTAAANRANVLEAYTDSVKIKKLLPKSSTTDIGASNDRFNYIYSKTGNFNVGIFNTSLNVNNGKFETDGSNTKIKNIFTVGENTTSGKKTSTFNGDVTINGTTYINGNIIPSAGCDIGQEGDEINTIYAKNLRIYNDAEYIHLSTDKLQTMAPLQVGLASANVTSTFYGDVTINGTTNVNSILKITAGNSVAIDVGTEDLSADRILLYHGNTNYTTIFGNGNINTAGAITVQGGEQGDTAINVSDGTFSVKSSTSVNTNKGYISTNSDAINVAFAAKQSDSGSYTFKVNNSGSITTSSYISAGGTIYAASNITSGGLIKSTVNTADTNAFENRDGNFAVDYNGNITGQALSATNITTTNITTTNITVDNINGVVADSWSTAQPYNSGDYFKIPKALHNKFICFRIKYKYDNSTNYYYTPIIYLIRPTTTRSEILLGTFYTQRWYCPTLVNDSNTPTISEYYLWSLNGDLSDDDFEALEYREISIK